MIWIHRRLPVETPAEADPVETTRSGQQRTEKSLGSDETETDRFLGSIKRLPERLRQRFTALRGHPFGTASLASRLGRISSAWGGAGRAPDDIPNVLDLSRPLDVACPAGRAFRVDSDAIANLWLNLREVVDGTGQPALEANLELSREAGQDLTDQLLAAGAVFDWFEVTSARVDEAGRLVFEPTDPETPEHSIFGRVLTLRTAHFEVECFPDQTAPQALRGKVRIRARGATEPERRQNLGRALSTTGLAAPLDPSTPQSRRLLLLLRLLWQVAPQRAYAIANQKGGNKSSAASRALRKAGVSAETIRGLHFEEVFPGYFTGVAPGLSKQYTRRGLRALIHTAPSAQGVLGIILAGGIFSGVERVRRGILIEGLSTEDDLRSGGLDFGFARGVFDGHRDLNLADVARYVLVLEPELLDRTDCFGYPEDRWGETHTNEDPRAEPSSALARAIEQDPLVSCQPSGTVPERDFLNRPVGDALVDQIEAQDPNDSLLNEFMFRTGIPLWAVDHVAAEDSEARDELLDLLRDQGVTEINGQPIEAFVVTRTGLLPAEPTA